MDNSYAGIFKRFLAVLIDFIIVLTGNIVLTALITVIIGKSVGARNPSIQTASATGAIVGNLVAFISMWLYFALMESSVYQGTLGKLTVAVRVTDLSGRRISFVRATFRYLGRLVSGMTLVGLLLVFFTKKRQTLHDLIAGTVVLKK